MRIERSMAAYWRNKGKLLCSSCLDRQEMLLKTVHPLLDCNRPQANTHTKANTHEAVF